MSKRTHEINPSVDATSDSFPITDPQTPNHFNFASIVMEIPSVPHYAPTRFNCKHRPVVERGWTWVWRPSEGEHGGETYVEWIREDKDKKLPSHVEGDGECPAGWVESLEPGDVVLRRVRRVSDGVQTRDVWVLPGSINEITKKQVPSYVLENWFFYDLQNLLSPTFIGTSIECVLSNLGHYVKQGFSWPASESNVIPDLRYVVHPAFSVKLILADQIERCREFLEAADVNSVNGAAFRQGLGLGLGLLQKMRRFDQFVTMPEVLEHAEMTMLHAAFKGRDWDKSIHILAWLREFIGNLPEAKRESGKVLSALALFLDGEGAEQSKRSRISGVAGQYISHEFEGIGGAIDWKTLENLLTPWGKLGHLMMVMN